MKPLPKITDVITDIEGTTTSIHFVYDTLFPFARKQLRPFLTAHKNNQIVQQLLHNAHANARLSHHETGNTCSAQQLEKDIRQFEKWMDEDRKVTALKTLQGLIWEQGYQTGELKGHLYPDVAECLQKWHQQGLSLGIYSSGSVAAQKLLFSHSICGDLSPLFSFHFDTHIGHKRETDSYRAILNAIHKHREDAHQHHQAAEPSSVLFLSDIREELDAASEAGLSTIGLFRQMSRTDAKNYFGPHRHCEDFYAIHQWLAASRD